MKHAGNPNHGIRGAPVVSTLPSSCCCCRVRLTSSRPVSCRLRMRWRGAVARPLFVTVSRAAVRRSRFRRRACCVVVLMYRRCCCTVLLHTSTVACQGASAGRSHCPAKVQAVARTSRPEANLSSAPVRAIARYRYHTTMPANTMPEITDVTR